MTALKATIAAAIAIAILLFALPVQGQMPERGPIVLEPSAEAVTVFCPGPVRWPWRATAGLESVHRLFRGPPGIVDSIYKTRWGGEVRIRRNEVRPRVFRMYAWATDSPNAIHVATRRCRNR